MKSVKVKKDKMFNWYVAEYKTLDLIAQGMTKKKALLELFNAIVITLDHAVKNNNLDNLVKGKK